MQVDIRLEAVKLAGDVLAHQDDSDIRATVRSSYLSALHISALALGTLHYCSDQCPTLCSIRSCICSMRGATHECCKLISCPAPWTAIMA